MKNIHLQQSQSGLLVHLKHYIPAKRKKKQVTLYYVTMLNCDECSFETIIYVSFQRAKARFEMEKESILSETEDDYIFEQKEYFLNTYSFVLELGHSKIN